MSEIQSIANGTYMIGETSDLNFEAGQGITITQPSEGTVRISNDETVLWDGNGTGATSVTLSESYYNFERVRFIYLFVTNWLECTVNTQSGISSLWLGNTLYRSGDRNPLQLVGFPVSITNNGLTATTSTGSAWWYPANGGDSLSAVKLIKVVGINRISGGNA